MILFAYTIKLVNHIILIDPQTKLNLITIMSLYKSIAIVEHQYMVQKWWCENDASESELFGILFNSSNLVVELSHHLFRSQNNFTFFWNNKRYNILRSTSMSVFCNIIYELVCYSITIRKMTTPNCISKSCNIFYQVCNLTRCLNFCVIDRIAIWEPISMIYWITASRSPLDRLANRHGFSYKDWAIPNWLPHTIMDFLIIPAKI